MDINKIQAQLDAAKDSKLAKISQGKLNSVLSLEWHSKNNATNGVHRTEEYRKKMSDVAKSKDYSHWAEFDWDPAMQKRKANGWDEKNNERWNDPEYKKEWKIKNEARLQNPEFMKKLREANIIAGKKRRKEIHTPFGIFDSLTAANKNMKKGDVCGKLKSHPHLYYYTSDGPGEPSYEKVYYTPAMVTTNRTAAHEAYCIASGNEVITTNQRAKDFWNKIIKIDPENYYTKKEVKREWLLED